MEPQLLIFTSQGNEAIWSPNVAISWTWLDIEDDEEDDDDGNIGNDDGDGDEENEENEDKDDWDNPWTFGTQ